MFSNTQQCVLHISQKQLLVEYEIITIDYN